MTSSNEAVPRTVKVEGELVFDSVPGRLRESAGWFTRNHGALVIDLGGVTRADSAGVALLLEWMRDAERAGAALRFCNAPAQMRSIIDFCSLGDVIPIDPSVSKAQAN